MDTTFSNLTSGLLLGDIWFPTDGSTSNQVDNLAIFILWICGFFLVFNAGLMVFFAVRYRQKKKEGAAHGSTHNTALEVGWSVLPAFILAIIFIWGFRNYLKMETPPENAYDIMVTGYKWGWDFTYPDGGQSKPETDPKTGEAKPPALHAPAGRPIRLTLQSNDVLHSVFIPEMRVKKDVVPGRFNQMWFEAEFNPDTAEVVELSDGEGGTVKVKRNVYDLFCTEYCGQNHSRMITKVYIYEQDGYDAWYKSKSEWTGPAWKVGETIWSTKCASCHSIDGSNTANYPTWLNLYGSTNHATSAGALTVDDAYIIESIRNPAAKLATPYGNQMAAFPDLTDREVRCIIEFMKTISDKVDGDKDLDYGRLNLDGTTKGEAEGEGGEESGEQDEAAEPEPVAEGQ